MNPLFQEIRHNRLLWLLALVPVLFAAAAVKPQAHELLFVFRSWPSSRLPRF